MNWDEFPAAARADRPADGGGTTIGFPAVVDNSALIYNKTVFDAAGLDYPTDDWTLGRLPRRRQEAHRPATQHLRLRLLGVGLGGDHLAVLAAPVAERRRDPLGGPEDGDLRLARRRRRADAPAGHGASTTRASTSTRPTPSSAQLFASDRIGMITSGPWQLYDLKTAKTTTASSILPGTDGDHQTVSGPDIWVAVRPQGRQPGPLVVRVHQVADLGRAGRCKLERRVRQPAAARVGGRVARVHRAGRRSCPGLDVMAANMRQRRSTLGRPSRATSASPRRSAPRSPRCCRARAARPTR